MQQNNSRQSNNSEIEFDFNAILRVLLSSRRLIIIITLAFGVIGWSYSYFLIPGSPLNHEATAVVEIGSYPATDEMLIYSRDGRILIASMEATVTRLDAMYGMHRSIKGAWQYEEDYSEMFQKIRIFEIDSQYLKIEVVGFVIDSVKKKINDIIADVKVLHNERLDVAISKRKREIQNIEEQLLTIDKFINLISKENDIYVSDVAVLKLKEIEYKHELKELESSLSNINTFKPTDILGEIQVKTNYPTSKVIQITLASFTIGFLLASLVAFFRHALVNINNYKE